MKDIVILLLVVIVLFLVWNSRVNYTAPVANDNVPVPADVIQAILEKVQSLKPDEYPIETLFITPQADGTYNSRFMFFNTKSFLGSQYDVKSKVSPDGTVEVVNMTDSVQPQQDITYKADVYKPYEDVTKSTDDQLKAVLATRPETPVVTNLRLGTRS
jgi:hypothetical protein